MTMNPSASGLFLLFVYMCVASLLPTFTTAQDLATFTEDQMDPSVNYRQNFCHLYQRVSNESDPLELKDALKGVQLRTLIGNYSTAYFNYNDETGINALNPGLQAELMDELARRGGFTWRESFGTFKDPTNESWTELLMWSIDTYDITVDWWAQSLERINMGAAFLTPWYDSSVILIKREVPPEISNEIKWWNWLRPYEPRVWYLSIFTIVLSGLVYQLLEWLSDDRGDRSFWDWFNYNCFISIINFTQASFEYQPKHFSGRIFGASMAIWALVMTATYTANLASLLVDRKAPPPEILTVSEAAHYGANICTVDGYAGDSYIQMQYPEAERLPLAGEGEIYKALHRGDCQFAAETVTSWNSKEGDRKFNPTCDLEWVGGDRKVMQSGAGFAIKSDAGKFCTGLIRDVINYHMEEIISTGFLKILWDKENKGDQCASYRPELEMLAEQEVNDAVPDDDEYMAPPERRRELQGQHRRTHNALHRSKRRSRRDLRGAVRGGAAGGAAAAGNTSNEGEDEALTMQQMLGSFMFHWMMLLISVGVAVFNRLHDRYVKRHALKALDMMGASLVGESTSIGKIAKKTTRMSVKVVSKIDKKLGGQSEQTHQTRQCSESLGRVRLSEPTERSERDEADERDDEADEATLCTAEDQSLFTRSSYAATSQPQSDEGLRKELESMRKSLAMMQDMQRQMLVEQWRSQEQIMQLTVAQMREKPSLVEASPLTVPYSSPPDEMGFCNEYEHEA